MGPNVHLYPQGKPYLLKMEWLVTSKLLYLFTGLRCIRSQKL